MDSNFSFIGESSPMMCPGGGGDGHSYNNVNHLDPTDPAPAIHEPNKHADRIVVHHAPAIHDPNKFDNGVGPNNSDTFMSQQSDIVFNTNALNNNSQHGGSPRGKVLRINSQDEVHDPSSVASVTSDRTRRSSTRYKEEDGDMEDTNQHGQTKPPVRKKGKTGSSDNRWSKRFTWPDAVSPLTCYNLFRYYDHIHAHKCFVSLILIILFTAPSRLCIRNLRCRTQACKSIHNC